MTYAEFIELAKANYTKGGDSYVECWEEYQFNDYVKMFGPVTKKKALQMFKDNAEIEAEYEAAARWAGGMDQENEAGKAKEEKKMMSFELEGRVYEKNEKGNRFFVSEESKGIVRKRISEVAYNKAWDEYLKTVEDNAEADEWQDEANAEVEARKVAEEEKDHKTEENFNKKKVAKPRRSKDIAFEMDTIEGHITLTAKQVDFIRHIPDTSFYEHGLDSMPWCDVLADEIGGQFAGKPMTVGAMISTLREKKLLFVGSDRVNGKRAKYFKFTIVGQVIAEKLGLH